MKMNRNRVYTDYWKALADRLKATSGPTIIKPILKTKDLDALLWFEHAFNRDADFEPRSEVSRAFHDALGHPFQQLPRQVLSDMNSASDYINGLIKYSLAQGDLSMKLADFTVKELSFDRPVFLTGESYLAWRNQFPIRSPTLTRKRANGLWWILTIVNEMEELAVDVFGTGEIYNLLEYSEGEELWDHGKRVLTGIARWHESRFPTAPRNVS